MRQWLLDNISLNLPPVEAGVLAGIILGDKTGMSREFYEYLKNSGLVHLVVVSGSNVILIVSSMIENLARLVGRKRAIVIGLATGWGYVGMVGWEAPVLRAILLVSIFYWAQMLGRKYDLARGLGLAVVIMAMADLGIVTSVSFWLSLMAFLAIITRNRFMIYDLRFMNRTIIKDLMTTVWVSAWITPILGAVFGKVSLIAPVANMMVLLVVEVITIVGMIAVLTGGWLLWLIFPLIRYFVWVVKGLGSWEWASIGIKFNWWMAAGWYLILIYFLVKRKDGIAK